MQFSFLGYSVKKIMEFNLDVKDVAILRYFDDFRKSGKMNYEVVDGAKYYWISYKSIENELPFLGLGKRTIMMRMLKLRDLGILSHYTKKEGGTFSFYALGERYKEILYLNESSNDYDNNNNITNNNDNIIYGQSDKKIINEEVSKDENSLNNDKSIISEKGNYNIINGEIQLNKNRVVNNEDGVLNNEEAVYKLEDLYVNNHKNEERLFKNNHRGYAEKCSTKTNLINNSSTIATNIYNIKENVFNIINYLNLKAGVTYEATNTKTISLIKARLREGFTFDDFKKVIDKKSKDWKGTSFEQYLNPFTLFGGKFEIYLNQKIVNQQESKNLRFHNFKGRDYDYDKLEKKLLGWE